MPWLITKRFTGTVNMKAMAKARAKLHQNKILCNLALMAPGINHSKVLPIISIEIIDMVSTAKASLSASFRLIDFLAPQSVKL